MSCGMGRITSQSFGKCPPGGKERWRLLREFTERWYGVSMPDVGGQQHAIARIEKGLKHELPLSVREWIAYVSDLANQSKVSLVLNGQARRMYQTSNDGYHFIVEERGESNDVCLLTQTFRESEAYWSVSHDKVAHLDPPVDHWAPTWDGLGDEPIHAQQPYFSRVSRSRYPLTTFIFDHVLFMLQGKRKTTSVSPRAADELCAEMRDAARYTRERFPVQSRIDHLEIFEGTNMILHLKPSNSSHEVFDMQLTGRHRSKSEFDSMSTMGYFF